MRHGRRRQWSETLNGAWSESCHSQHHQDLYYGLLDFCGETLTTSQATTLRLVLACRNAMIVLGM